MLMTTHWAYAIVLMSSMIFAEVDVKVSVFSGIGSDEASLSERPFISTKRFK